MSRRRKLLLHMAFGWINLSLAAPAIYLWLGLPLVMRQQGWSGSEIGLFQLAGLPAVFKLFLALPIERKSDATAPCRQWFAVTSCGYLFTLLALAATDGTASKMLLFTLVFLAALCAAWADIPANTLALKSLAAEEHARLGSVRSAATFIAAILGGGAMLLVEQSWGWRAPLIVLAAAVASTILTIGFVRETGEGNQPRQPTAIALWRGFLLQPDGRCWTTALLCYFPCIASAWVYLKPLLLDQGFPPGQVAWIAGIGGGVIGVLSSLAIGLFAPARLPKMLTLSAGVNVLTLLLLAVANEYASRVLLQFAVPMLACAMGATSALAFSLIMTFTRDHSRAADYGLQASLFTLGRILAATLAGVVLDHLGYTLMLTTLAGTGVIAFLMMQRMEIAHRNDGARQFPHRG